MDQHNHFYSTKNCFKLKKKNNSDASRRPAELCMGCISHLRSEWSFVTLSDWENYQTPTKRSQHLEPILVSPQSEIVSLHLFLSDTEALMLAPAARTWRWERGEDRDAAEAVIGQVSREDAKPSGQRVTARGRLSHPADGAKTDETISAAEARTVPQPSCILCLRAAFHNISTLSSASSPATIRNVLWTHEMFTYLFNIYLTRLVSHVSFTNEQKKL